MGVSHTVFAKFTGIRLVILPDTRCSRHEGTPTMLQVQPFRSHSVETTVALANRFRAYQIVHCCLARSLISHAQCVAFPHPLPVRTATAANSSSSRPSCLSAAPTASPRRARDVTSREVSRRYVAPPRDVTARQSAAARGAGRPVMHAWEFLSSFVNS